MVQFFRTKLSQNLPGISRELGDNDCVPRFLFLAGFDPLPIPRLLETQSTLNNGIPKVPMFLFNSTANIKYSDIYFTM
jgi:hypothetical protein